jgi:cyclopropane fatty-acyl-phospholipid synthase-like methyltransferase
MASPITSQRQADPARARVEREAPVRHATGTAPRARQAEVSRFEKVVHCYDAASLSLLVGIEDYTDGVYHGDRSTPYAVAQRAQHEYLLDQLGVRPGFRLLDVGCGSGSLLRGAHERGADATGITISPPQVDLGHARGLDVRLMNYLDLAKHFGREFDGVVANGSIEHFCQPEVARAGGQEAVYARMFELVEGVLRTDSPARRVVTTVIHFRGDGVPPERILRFPLWLPFERRAFHLGILHRGYGGYYPAAGQLARCASPWFELVCEQDGTLDYHFTADDWLAKVRAGLRRNQVFRRELLRLFVRRPRHTFWFALSFLGPESWHWQFRGAVPPTMLLRQTWKAVG